MAESTEPGAEGDVPESAAAPATEAPESDVAAPESSPGTDVDAEPSSAEEGVKEPKSYLEAAMAAINKAAGPDDAPASESEEQDVDAAKPEEDAAPDEPVEATAEPEGKDAELPFAKHPRFKQLLTQRNEFKAKAEATDARLKELEPKAKNFDNLTRYAHESNFSSEDFTNLLKMGRLMKSDPIAFHEAFAPYWSEIEKAAGARLPEDLAVKVEAGTIDVETAQELARQRAKAAVADTKLQRTQAQIEQEREEKAKERQNDIRVAIGNTASAWESQWKKSDPDYAKKQPRVMDRVVRLMQEQMPSSADEALAICNKAKKQVDDEIRRLLPRRQAVQPTNSGTSVDTQGQPKTLLEAAMQAQERHRASR